MCDCVHEYGLIWKTELPFTINKGLSWYHLRSIHFRARPQPDIITPKYYGDRFCDLTGSGPQSVQVWAEWAAKERHVINGSYREVVALGSWLCFPPITLTGRKMRRGGNGWNSERQTLIFTCLLTDKESRRRHGEGLPDTVLVHRVWVLNVMTRVFIWLCIVTITTS